VVNQAARLRRLEDADAIRNLLASYGLLADSGASTELALLWTEYGEYDVGGYGTAKGRDAIAALIESETHQQLLQAGCAHILSPHVIEVVDERATAAGYSVVWRYNEGAMEPWRVSWNTWELVRQRSQWFVQRRINRPISMSIGHKNDLFMATLSQSTDRRSPG
jgi:hypothetical protein